LQKKSLVFGLLGSLGMLLVIVGPFIFSKKYQAWFLESGVQGYTFSILITIVVSLLIALLVRTISSKLIVIVCALIFLGTHYVNTQSHQSIVLDNRRWESVDKIFTTNLLKKFVITSEEVYAPVLWDHTWWLGFFNEASYWQTYTSQKFQKIPFTKKRSRDGALSIFDYQSGSLLFAYKSDNIKNEVFNVIVVHPGGMPIRLLSNNGASLETGETQCTKRHCATLFHGIFKSNAAIITADARYSLRVF
jgi:hypothetical protein